jgi:hypothetical protein
MPIAAIATIVISLIILVAVALYLIRVVVILKAVNDSLGKITFGVRAIAHRTSPLAAILGPALGDLKDVASALGAAAASVTTSSETAKGA